MSATAAPRLPREGTQIRRVVDEVRTMGGWVRPRDVARRLGITNQRAAQALGDAVRLGYIKRAAVENDGLFRHVYSFDG